MATRTLLNEAIAEATSIKEAALANAKAALEESFAPHIKELFSKKVQELENEEKNVKEMKEKDHNKEIEEQAEDISLESLLSKLDEIEETEELDEMSDPVMRKGMKGDDAAEKETEKMRLKEEDEESLEESEETVDEGYDNYEEDDTKMEQEEEEEESKEMEAEIDLDDMSEEDLKDFIEDVMKDMVAAGELEPGPDFEAEEGEEEGEMEDSEEVEITMDSDDEMMEESEEIEESEELAEERGGKKGDEHKDDMKKKGHHGKGPKRKETAEEEGEIDYMKEEEVTEASHDDEDGEMEEGYGMKKHKKEMEEALAEIESLKKDLQEVNLLNAKLLYANKLFKDKNLSESQKVKVLESFDKANSTKEAKLVYETLIEGIKSRPTFKRRSMVSEIKGSASKPTQVVKENKNQIVESDGMVTRFQKLAGII